MFPQNLTGGVQLDAIHKILKQRVDWNRGYLGYGVLQQENKMDGKWIYVEKPNEDKKTSKKNQK